MTKNAGGRPPKYATEAERKAARLESKRKCRANKIATDPDYAANEKQRLKKVKLEYKERNPDGYREYTKRRAKHQSEYRRQSNAKRPPDSRPFIGIDGEGGTRNGHHAYYLLRVGEKVLYKNGEPLTGRECLDFLFNECVDSDAIPVAFFFNYDVTMILRDLPFDIQQQICDRTSRTERDEKGKVTTKKVRWLNYLIDYLPGRMFSIGMFEPGESGSFRNVEISDAQGFFQCSFVKALRTWKVGTPDIWDRIEGDKAKRNEFTGLYSAEEIEYNRMEVELLEELMTKLRDACAHAEIRPRKWQGAGQLAQAMHTTFSTPKKVTDEMPAAVQEAAQYAYFGGRFETSIVGHVRADGPIWEADISSAYPAAMTHLVCMRPGCGRWRKTKVLPNHPHYLAKIAWECHPDTLWAPFLFRSKQGRVIMPLSGKGWVHGFELREAMNNPTLDLSTFQILEYQADCVCGHSFEWIKEKFAERVSIGASDRGMILKLGLNSLYGKICQSVGTAPFANPVWAGQITSWTRAQLYSVLRHHPQEDLIMVATDAVYLKNKPKFHVSEIKTLGGWDATSFDQMFIVQPGLYYCGGEHRKAKTRGIPQKVVGNRLDLFTNVWARDGWDGCVDIEIPNSFIGMREAIHRKKPEIMGQWVPEKKSIRFAPVSRRSHSIENGEGYTVPYSHVKDHDESAMYKRKIGGIFSQLNQSDDQEFPEHPDGSVYLIDQILSEF